MLEKRVLRQKDLAVFEKSATGTEILEFVLALNDACKNVPLNADCAVSENVQKLLAALDQVEQLVKATPPIATASRFGNPAFRELYDKIEDAQLLKEFGLTADDDASQYLCRAFGDRERIDYGSGHELNFMCCLLCLKKQGFLTENDYCALVIKVFEKYIKVMRHIQAIYFLEPAGSHGVWGLDDYHFLPFMFGSAQLYNHKYLRPKSIHDIDVLESYSHLSMYLDAVRYVNSVKTASLRWHSPMLDDISGAKSWSKINDGMIKMYKAEVLGKLPIMQHFLFGSILPADPDMSPAGTEPEHVHNTWGDCCGIKVPSAVAAAAADGYTIPFD
ncbi:hypothetical protein CANCADRAFT_127901 [Tortispora caseinolytica NRRL Y-17796]|uniref:Serine/threonine-protein phosphatase 2A activator n=1 Tax=Tortispora caseinolytica NRRL Y-17796 TaxID=767744 RepID=A0A1E4TAD3_9ASCO|nr:hypothetical protein CANCADRAFT_127901 [Tortispora caseinolytica NRRL Y-17796]